TGMTICGSESLMYKSMECDPSYKDLATDIKREEWLYVSCLMLKLSIGLLITAVTDWFVCSLSSVFTITENLQPLIILLTVAGAWIGSFHGRHLQCPESFNIKTIHVSLSTRSIYISYRIVVLVLENILENLDMYVFFKGSKLCFSMKIANFLVPKSLNLQNFRIPRCSWMFSGNSPEIPRSFQTITRNSMLSLHYLRIPNVQSLEAESRSKEAILELLVGAKCSLVTLESLEAESPSVETLLELLWMPNVLAAKRSNFSVDRSDFQTFVINPRVHRSLDALLELLVAVKLGTLLEILMNAKRSLETLESLEVASLSLETLLEFLVAVKRSLEILASLDFAKAAESLEAEKSLETQESVKRSLEILESLDAEITSVGAILKLLVATKRLVETLEFLEVASRSISVQLIKMFISLEIDLSSALESKCLSTRSLDFLTYFVISVRSTEFILELLDHAWRSLEMLLESLVFFMRSAELLLTSLRIPVESILESKKLIFCLLPAVESVWRGSSSYIRSSSISSLKCNPFKIGNPSFYSIFWMSPCWRMFFNAYLELFWNYQILNNFRCRRDHSGCLYILRRLDLQNILICPRVVVSVNDFYNYFNLNVCSVLDKKPKMGWVVFVDNYIQHNAVYMFTVRLLMNLVFLLWISGMLEPVLYNAEHFREIKKWIVLTTICTIVFAMSVPVNVYKEYLVLIRIFAFDNIRVIILLTLSIAIFLSYGAANLCDDMAFVMGHRPVMFWRYCWYFYLPVISVLSYAAFKGAYELHFNLKRGNIAFATHTVYLVAFGIIVLAMIIQVIRYSIKCNFPGLFKPDNKWGPADYTKRINRLYFTPGTVERSKNPYFKCNHVCLRNSKAVKNRERLLQRKREAYLEFINPAGLSEDGRNNRQVESS
ncbi:hypothetical protein L9F63_013042, partial [Diploptera punctata]